VKTAVFLIFALFTAILGQLFNSEIFVFSAAFVFLIINYLFAFGNISFFDLAFVNILFDRYRALNIFNIHAGFLIFVIALLAVIFIALIILSFVLKLKSKDFIFLPAKIKSLINSIKKSDKIKSIKPSYNGCTSILRFEFNKSLLNKKHIIILIAAIAAKIIIANIYFTPLVTNEERIYQNYIANLHGKITEQQSEFIREEREYINRVSAEFFTAQDAFRNGEMDLPEFTGYNQRYNYAQSVERPFGRIEERHNYLLHTLNRFGNFDNIEFIYEAGALKYLFSFFDIILVLFVIAVFANIFSNEYQSGFISIMSISKNGGKKTFNAKYLFGFISITAVYIIFAAIDLIFLFRHFNMDYLNAGIMSIPDFAGLELNISISEYFIIFNIIRYISFVALTMIIISLSNIAKNVLTSVLAALFIIFVPSFLEFFGVNVLRFMNITSILNPTFIQDYIPQYIFYLIFTTVLFVKSKLDWVKK
jgi:hypothetical protein